MKLIFEEIERYRLDKFLQEKLPLSRTKIQELIKEGAITLNGEKTNVHHFLKNGDLVEYDRKIVKERAETKPFKTNKKVKYEVIDETDDYLIINKQSGLMVHPTEKMEDDTLVNGLLAKYKKLKDVGDDPLRPGIVHRLDKKVSGLLLVAKNQEAFEYYKNLFSTREIDKVYTALVHEKMPKPSGQIDFKISRSKTKSGRMAAHPKDYEEARDALTLYETVKEFTHFTLLKVKIITGRTHQIRVHFNAVGHPILGDNLYTQKGLKQSIELGRPFLHASTLSFVDRQGQQKSYTSPLPKELNDILEKLQ